jgi:4-carboxymuconolactone decarboxylase
MSYLVRMIKADLVRRWTILTLLVACGTALAAQNPAPATAPRVEPLPEAEWTSDVQSAFKRFGDGTKASNDFKTLARHPELLTNVMPFVAYVSRESTLPPKDRELLILRTAWLCRSEYLWAQHAAIAARVGIAQTDLRRIAQGPAAAGWDEFDATLLRAADELHLNAFMTDATWAALAKRYDRNQIMDVLFAAGAGTIISATLNTAGVPLDAALTARLPTDVPAGTTVARMSASEIRLNKPRVAPLEPAEWTPEVLAMLDPTNSGRPIGAVFRTYAQHPRAYLSRQLVSDYIRAKLTLTDRTKEMLILRIAWLCNSAYQWNTHEQAARRLGMTDQEILALAQGPGAAVWEPFDAAVIRSVDELHRDGRIGDGTWNMLSRHYNTQQLMDVVIAAVGYRMVSMSLNSLGLQLEPGARGLPLLGGR